MNIIRNIYCEGVYEGSYKLCYTHTQEKYIWKIIEKNIYPELHIEKGRDYNSFISSTYHYWRTIPFQESDLDGDF